MALSPFSSRNSVCMENVHNFVTFPQGWPPFQGKGYMILQISNTSNNFFKCANCTFVIATDQSKPFQAAWLRSVAPATFLHYVFPAEIFSTVFSQLTYSAHRRAEDSPCFHQICALSVSNNFIITPEISTLNGLLNLIFQTPLEFVKLGNLRPSIASSRVHVQTSQVPQPTCYWTFMTVGEPGLSRPSQ